MMKYSGLPVVLALLLVAAQVHAALYRWVDDNGQVQYSDKPPVAGAKKGVSVLDTQGMVRKEPAPQLTPEEKARLQTEKAQQLDQQRRDRALLQSFSSPKDIDILRDRQIESVQASLQTNTLRRQSGQAKLDRLNTQVATIQKRGRTPPADMLGEVLATQKEINDIDDDTRVKQASIVTIRQHAEEDKKRLNELQAGR
ncbi:DUF4124 domain-containing protein [Silvimonas sp.]|uniref:DUF4124 domain-containing protein n=1 Tax=Silvimonas sp. TaxID=2650811 RepID=UPI0028495E84|nr:DUF4124 domain-containing protein [Silvimonas sp.]MDR3429840.1 DUF4124 domain-containing protein [Silvimonas sp.]